MVEFPLSSRMPRWLTRIGCPDPRFRAYVLLALGGLVVLGVSSRVGLDSGEVLGWMVAVSVLATDIVRRLFGNDAGPVSATLTADGK